MNKIHEKNEKSIKKLKNKENNRKIAKNVKKQ
jgi:hypothetical protein